MDSKLNSTDGKKEKLEKIIWIPCNSSKDIVLKIISIFLYNACKYIYFNVFESVICFLITNFLLGIEPKLSHTAML